MTALTVTAAGTIDRIGQRLAVPPQLPAETGYGPASPRWLGQSLSSGAAGITLLHAVRAHTGATDWQPATAWWAHAVGEQLNGGPSSGLWHGVAAVAFAGSFLPPGRFPGARRTLHEAVTRLVASRVRDAHARIDAGVRPDQRREFDLVYGLAGLGAYLLRVDPGGPELAAVLTYLVRLAQPLAIHDAAGPHAPGWWTSDTPEGQPLPAGHANLGMAHGISGGPLALLALAARHGVIVPGQLDALDQICAWMDNWRQGTVGAAWWPRHLTAAEHRDRQTTQTGPGRPSWCYGTPGIARAVQLAAIVLGDTRRQQLAEDAIASCLDDPAQRAQISDPGLCHGWAGVLATARAAARDARSTRIAAHLPDLTAVLIDEADREVPHTRRPGLIDGAAGIAISLLAATDTGWDRCLLIN